MKAAQNVPMEQGAAVDAFAPGAERNVPPPPHSSNPPPMGERVRLNLDPENVKSGVAQLVLILVKLLHELLERQAIRRMEAGSLTDAEIEKLGLALMKQLEEIERLCREFGLEEKDLNIDLGPLGKLL